MLASTCISIYSVEEAHLDLTQRLTYLGKVMAYLPYEALATPHGPHYVMGD